MTDPVSDAVSFLGEMDLHLIGEGRHEQLWDVLGAHVRTTDGVTGTSFAVWAPRAREVRIAGDFNYWSGQDQIMRPVGTAASGNCSSLTSATVPLQVPRPRG